MIDLAEVDKIYPLMVEYRRHIHENPELGMDTVETKNYVKKLATDLGFSIKEVGNGLIVDYGTNPGIALRADMDSLPIVEETGLKFSSKVSGMSPYLSLIAFMSCKLWKGRMRMG